MFSCVKNLKNKFSKRKMPNEETVLKNPKDDEQQAPQSQKEIESFTEEKSSPNDHHNKNDAIETDDAESEDYAMDDNSHTTPRYNLRSHVNI
jgi:hypothetical protein